MKTLKHINIYLFWLVFCCFITCFAFIYLEFPVCIDDWLYLGQIMYDGKSDDGSHTIYSGIKSCLTQHYLYDTSRFGNTLGALSLLLPLFMSKCIILIALTLGLYLMIKVIGINQNQPLALSLLCFFILFFVNWGEHMFTIMFAFNYIVVLPLFFGLLYVFFNKKKINIYLIILLGLILGAWHESYSLTFGAIVFILIIINPTLRTKTNFILLLSVIIGILWIFIWPAIWHRNNSNNFTFEGLKRITYIFPFFFVIISLFFKKNRSLRNSNLIIATVVCAIITCPLLIYTTHIRAVMPLYFLSCCSMTKILINWWPGRINYSKVRYGFLVLINLISFLHLGAVCVETVILKRHINNIVVKALEQKDYGGDLFAKVRYPWQASWLTLFRPEQDVLVPGWGTFETIKKYTQNYNLGYPIPIELKDFSKEKGKVIDKDGKYKIYKGYIVSLNPEDSMARWMCLRYKHFQERNNTIRIPFTGQDGAEYLYVSPMRSKKSIFFGDPIYILEE